MINLSFDSNTSLVPQTLGITPMEYILMHQQQQQHHQQLQKQSNFFTNQNNLNNSFDSIKHETTIMPKLSVDEYSCLIFIFGYDDDDHNVDPKNNQIDQAVERFIREVNIKCQVFSLFLFFKYYNFLSSTFIGY